MRNVKIKMSIKGIVKTFSEVFEDHSVHMKT